MANVDTPNIIGKKQQQYSYGNSKHKKNTICLKILLSLFMMLKYLKINMKKNTTKAILVNVYLRIFIYFAISYKKMNINWYIETGKKGNTRFVTVLYFGENKSNLHNWILSKRRVFRFVDTAELPSQKSSKYLDRIGCC